MEDAGALPYGPLGPRAHGPVGGRAGSWSACVRRRPASARRLLVDVRSGWDAVPAVPGRAADRRGTACRARATPSGVRRYSAGRAPARRGVPRERVRQEPRDDRLDLEAGRVRGAPSTVTWVSGSMWSAKSKYCFRAVPEVRAHDRDPARRAPSPRRIWSRKSAIVVLASPGARGSWRRRSPSKYSSGSSTSRMSAKIAFTSDRGRCSG